MLSLSHSPSIQLNASAALWQGPLTGGPWPWERLAMVCHPHEAEAALDARSCFNFIPMPNPHNPGCPKSIDLHHPRLELFPSCGTVKIHNPRVK